jgi:hypothetical protein
MQIIAAHLVYAYTGMRRSELIVMPFDSYTEIDMGDGEKIACINSHTKKLESDNYSKKIPWITTRELSKAIDVAKAIAKINYLKLKKDKPFPKDHSSIPLWLSSNKRSNPNSGHYDLPTLVSASLHGSKLKINDSDLTVITQSDIDELVAFDAFRDWDSDPKFEVGKQWPFSSHQFRRSVAVYASRSNMVSLPSLATQYKHMSQVMTAYYANNSTFAESFIIDNGKIPNSHKVLEDFRDSQAFNASVIFHEKVIRAESKLSGGQGIAIEKNKENDKLPKIMESVEETNKAVKNGQLSYIENEVGGCMLGKVCDRYELAVVLPCVFSCEHSVIGGDNNVKLSKYVDGLEIALHENDEASPTYRVIKNEIEKIRHLYLDGDKK